MSEGIEVDINDDATASMGESEGNGGSSSGCFSCIRRSCTCASFKGNEKAIGLSLCGSARGALVMSNIFMSSSLIYLATEAAGCLEGDDQCQTKVYGFLPASLIPNIAVMSGVLSAILMPLIGAIVDFTPYRRQVGIASAALLTLIQGVQIYTVSSTWFPMAILQALSGFIYQIQVLAIYSYLPELAAEVGQKTMTGFSSKLTFVQFSSQALFLVAVILLSTLLSMNSVSTAQASQIFNCLWISIDFYLGWRKLPLAGCRHEGLPEGSSNLISAGFVQLWNTWRAINRYYRTSLRWYFLALVFAEAGVNAFTVVAVTFQTIQLGMNGSEIGIQFLVVLVASLPGTKLASYLSKRFNPKISWICSLLSFTTVTVIAGFVLTGPSMKMISYVFGVLWGVCIGWFYPTENLVFSMLLPKGQEAELSGIYVYCTQIIVWLPPLLFTIINEAGMNLKWGLLSLTLFMLTAVGMIFMMADWDDMCQEVAKTVEGVNGAVPNEAKNPADIPALESSNEPVIAQEP